MVTGQAAGNTAVFGDSSHGTAAAVVSVSQAVSGQTLTPTAGIVGLSLVNPPTIATLLMQPATAGTAVVAVLSSPAATPTEVSITSTNPAVVTATSGPIAAGQQMATLSIVTSQAGTATLIVRAGGETRSVTINVGGGTPAAIPYLFTKPVGASLLAPPSIGHFLTVANRQASLSLTLLSAPAAVDTPVTIASSNPAVATATSGPVAAGSQVAQVSITSIADGMTSIVLRAGSDTRLLTIVVGAPTLDRVPLFAERPVGVSVVAGSSLGHVLAPRDVVSLPTLRIPLLPTPAPAPIQVSITSGAPSIVNVGVSGSTTATIAQGQQVIDLPLSIAGTQGAPVLVFEFGGQRRELLVIVGTPPAAQIPLLAAPIVGIEIKQ
jgi:hypothetical protein